MKKEKIKKGNNVKLILVILSVLLAVSLAVNVWLLYNEGTFPPENYNEDDYQRALSGDTNLAGANLEGADFRGAYLERADLTGANLEGADLRRAELAGASLRRANLEGAFVDIDTDLLGACLAETNLAGVSGLTPEQKQYARNWGALNVPEDRRGW